jgi:hypothetical protein
MEKRFDQGLFEAKKDKGLMPLRSRLIKSEPIRLLVSFQASYGSCEMITLEVPRLDLALQE